MSLDPADALVRLIPVAQAAGAVLLRHDGRQPAARRGLAARLKSERDPVTAADLESERLIAAQLRQAFPGIAIQAEEEVREAGGGGPVAIVDPLDGTVNFTMAHPFFCVSIALFAEGRPLAAVVHAPRLAETFTAAAGCGTRLNGVRVAVSDESRLSHALLASGFAYRRNELADDNLGNLAALLPRCRDIRRCGSAALDLAYVAAGRLDGFWEPHLNAWDVAAGALLVTEAGGCVSDMSGGQGWLAGGSIVAAGAALHVQLLAQLRSGPG